MKPVDQTRDGRNRGNCFAAALASLLELPLEALPDFAMKDDLWIHEVNAWLDPQGWRAINVRLDDPEEAKAVWGDAIVLAGGVSPRDDRGPERLCHEVVWQNGRILHDPHPTRAGLRGKPLDYTVLFPKDPGGRIRP